MTGMESWHYAKKVEVGDGEWRVLANCQGVDPDLFFIERGESSSPAKAVCRACLVREPCLEYALTNCEKFGVWGGLSERERRRMRQERNRSRRAS